MWNYQKVSIEFLFSNGISLIFVVKNFILTDLACRILHSSVTTRKLCYRNSSILNVISRWSIILGYMPKQSWLLCNNKKYLNYLKILSEFVIINWKIRTLNQKTRKNYNDSINTWNMSKSVTYLISLKIKSTMTLVFNYIISWLLSKIKDSDFTVDNFSHQM